MLCLLPDATAQTYVSRTPYSVFGFGDMMQPGTAYNKTMGGVGAATRNHRFINILNPAAVTARDSLAFMADFSLYEDNKMFRQNDMRSVSNTFNVNDLVMSFPIYKSSAMMLGITPYSSTGFAYQNPITDAGIIGSTGAITESGAGRGSLYDAFAAAGVTFWNRISVGAQLTFTFGNFEKKYSTSFTDASYNSIISGSFAQLHGFSGKFGVQYEQPIGTKSKIVVGGTYRMGTKFSGYTGEYIFAAQDTLSYKADTLSSRIGKVKSADEITVGVSFMSGDNFMVELDYTRADWSATGLDKISVFTTNINSNPSYSMFSTAVSESYRFGVEWVPNRNDIRYYLKRCAYRAGVYYKKDYFKVDGHDVNSMGITLGATLPIYQWYNGLTLGVEFGQRGSVSNNLIRERYVNFSIGINIFDIWFRKTQYQ
ncbi:MAG: hypothetical protein MJY89_05260 [Bacteroidales bacterium]|nr:hypothetical protein [Bacteroidales bacterium]